MTRQKITATKGGITKEFTLQVWEKLPEDKDGTRNGWVVASETPKELQGDNVDAELIALRAKYESLSDGKKAGNMKKETLEAKIKDLEEAAQAGNSDNQNPE